MVQVTVEFGVLTREKVGTNIQWLVNIMIPDCDDYPFNCCENCSEDDVCERPKIFTGVMSIEDVKLELFLTSEWVVIARVGSTVIDRSSSSSQPHSDKFIQFWARRLIKQEKDRLIALDVDVVAEFLARGGVKEDL